VDLERPGGCPGTPLGVCAAGGMRGRIVVGWAASVGPPGGREMANSEEWWEGGCAGGWCLLCAARVGM